MNASRLAAKRPDAPSDSLGNPRRILRGTAAYTVGAVLQRAVTFLLLPFFARVLSPAEFGQIGVITTIAAALSVIVSFGLETAVFRGYLRARKDANEAHTFVNTVGGFALLVPIAVAAAFSVLAAPALAPVFGLSADALRLASVGAAATASATLVPLALLRAQERLGGYLQLTAVQVIVTPVLTILFVSVLAWGVVGWMLAYALSSIVLLLRGMMILRHEWSLDFNLAHLRRALLFGLPLMPHALSHWGLSVSDRAILGAFVSAPQVGAYYVGYLFSLPISLVAIALSQATQPLYAEADSGAKGRSEIGMVIAVQTVLIVLIAAVVALVGAPVSILLLPPEYVTTAELIPWLAAGTCLFGLYLMPMNAIAVMAGRTRRVWIITVLAAAANIGLNLVLVPRIGAVAAAVNTTIGYGFLFVGVFLYMRRVCDPPIPYEATRIAKGILVVGIPSILAAALTPLDSAVGLAVRVAVILGVSALLLIGPFRHEARAGWRAVRPGHAGEQA